MPGRLLERDAELDVLAAALDGAAAGRGSVVLIFGEAGIGKTSLVRSYVRQISARARVLQGACDDLTTPRTLGPLRDAVPGGHGPLATALAGTNRDDVLTGVVAELSEPTASTVQSAPAAQTAQSRPTVLVIEDVHWADDATLDVLRYLGRRITDLPALLMITYRDDEVSRDHPAHRLIGSLGGEGVHRLGLRRLSRTGVATLAGGTAATSAPLFHVTAGNPFFLSEVLATREDTVPLTVVDAVLARVHRLDPATQAALEQLSVVPGRVELSLARALLGDLTVLAPAERRGVLEVRPDAVAFRHELARRAVEGSLPTSERMQLNARVLAALLSRTEPDLSRLVHHGVEAGDDAVVAEYGRAAAAQAAAAGAHTQAILFFERVLARRHLLDLSTQAEVLQAMTESLFLVDRMADAMSAAQAAVAIRDQQGEREALGEVYCALAPIYWITARPDEALDAATRAVDLLRTDGRSPRLAYALLYLGLVQTATGRLDGLPAVAEEALGMAQVVGAPDLIAMGRTLHGRTRLLTGDQAGIGEMTDGLQGAIASGNHVFVMMSYVLMAQDYWDLGRFDQVDRFVQEGLSYTSEREVDFYAGHLRAHQARLTSLRGNWAAAEGILRELVGVRGGREPGTLRYALPALAVIATRRDTDDAEDLLDWSLDFARRAGGYYDTIPAAFAELENAWLTGRPELAKGATARILAFSGAGLQPRHRGELQRWLRRLGLPAAEFPGCPEVFAAGIRGDWRAAAAEWERIGSPYHRAMELVDSGEPDPTLEALQVFDSLGSPGAVQIARRRLRELGITQLPRGPKQTTRTNPAGLTERQLEILTMLGSGMTNAEIAASLVVSVRTVDHHVSAVLQKLGLSSRRQAAKAAVDLGLDDRAVGDR